MLSKLIILSACLFSLTFASKPGPIGKPTCAATLCIKGTTCVETPTGAKCVPSEPIFCPQVFDPVCCKFNNGEVKTAGNSCECRGKVLSEGECKPKPCICTLEFNPVCCKTDKGFKIESNPCFCKCQKGAQVVSKRNCSKCSKCDGKREQVCCKLNNRVRTVRNKCRCECRGGSIVKGYNGKCKY